MSDFFRDLLVGEAQQSPYVWAAVMWAHAMIGVCLAAVFGPLAVRYDRSFLTGFLIALGSYAGWEVLQISRGGPVLDGILDLSAVALGALIAMCLWERRAGSILRAIFAVILICLAGIKRRVL